MNCKNCQELEKNFRTLEENYDYLYRNYRQLIKTLQAMVDIEGVLLNKRNKKNCGDD